MELAGILEETSDYPRKLQQPWAPTGIRGCIKVNRGYMGGCQNYGPFLGTLNIRGRIIIGTQKKGP